MSVKDYGLSQYRENMTVCSIQSGNCVYISIKVDEGSATSVFNAFLVWISIINYLYTNLCPFLIQLQQFEHLIENISLRLSYANLFLFD